MTSVPKRLAMIVTDAGSFNVLYQGQLEHLRDSGVDLTLFCGGSLDSRAQVKARQLGRVCYVPMRRRPNLPLDLLSLAWLTVLLMARRFDAITYSTPKAMFLGALAAFMTRQPRRTAVVHGRAYETLKGKWRGAFLTLDRIAFACSHQVLFVSQSLRDAYEADDERMIRKARVLGFGSCNGVDLSRFRPAASSREKAALRAELGIPADAFVVIVVGRICRDKGIREIAQLIERLGPDTRLAWIFVGSVEDTESSALIESVRGHQVIHVGFSREVERWFRAVDLHLFLSHREGFGNVAIEAAASGVPTFAFDVIGIRDSVINGVTGILFPRCHGVEPIAREIRVAVSDRAGFANRFSYARTIVGERFEKHNIWDLFEKAYLVPDDTIISAASSSPMEGSL